MTLTTKCRDLVRHYLGPEWSFVAGQRSSVTRYGYCNHRRKTISLCANHIAAASMYGMEVLLLDAVLHEIAHGIAGPSVGHGREWKRIASEIGCTFLQAHDKRANKLCNAAKRVAGSCLR